MYDFTMIYDLFYDFAMIAFMICLGFVYDFIV